MDWFDSRCACFFGVLFLVGCGGNSVSIEKLNGGPLKEVVPVSGFVTVDGEPKAGVELALHSPEGRDVVKTTETDATGKFCWTSLKACDGAAIGEYKVTIRYVVKANRKGDGDDLLKGRYDYDNSEFALKVESGKPQADLKYELSTK